MLSGRPVAIVLGDGAIAKSDRVAALDLPRQRVTTVYVTIDDDIQKRIDGKLRRKYGDDTESVNAMLTDDARVCTLRIEELHQRSGD